MNCLEILHRRYREDLNSSARQHASKMLMSYRYGLHYKEQ